MKIEQTLWITMKIILMRPDFDMKPISQMSLEARNGSQRLSGPVF